MNERYTKAVNGIILCALYMTEDDFKNRILTLFHWQHRRYTYLLICTPEHFEDDSYLIHIVNTKIL